MSNFSFIYTFLKYSHDYSKSVREIGLNWFQFSKVASLRTGIRPALFQTVGILPLLKEELNIFVMVGASSTPNSFQSQYGKSSGPDDVHF